MAIRKQVYFQLVSSAEEKQEMIRLLFHDIYTMCVYKYTAGQSDSVAART